MSSKIHLVTTEHGRVLGVGLGEGQAGDAPAAAPLLAYVLADERITALAADRAYDSDAIRGALALAGKEAVIPPKRNRLAPPPCDKTKYRGRNVQHQSAEQENASYLLFSSVLSMLTIAGFIWLLG